MRQSWNACCRKWSQWETEVCVGVRTGGLCLCSGPFVSLWLHGCFKLVTAACYLHAIVFVNEHSIRLNWQLYTVTRCLFKLCFLLLHVVDIFSLLAFHCQTVWLSALAHVQKKVKSLHREKVRERKSKKCGCLSGAGGAPSKWKATLKVRKSAPKTKT